MGLHTYAIADGRALPRKAKSTFILEVEVRNEYDYAALDTTVYVESLSAAATVVTPTITIDRIARFGVEKVPVGFEVVLEEDLPCAGTLEFRVQTKESDGDRFSDRVDLSTGYRSLAIDRLHEAPNWTVDPDGSDTAVSGHWELGEPECGYVLEVVTQPETDRTMGDGKLSFHTGSKIGPNFDSFDVDGGRTTLESPVFSFGDARYPALVFYAWHVGVDFSRQGGPQAIGEGLVVEASNDGGKTWTEIDRVTENTEDWQRRTIPIREHLEPTQRMRFRFSIEDRTAVGVVEAGIDDLEIVDLMDHCEIPPPAAPVGGSQGPSGAIKPASDSGCNGTEVPRSRFPYGTMAVVFGLAAWLRARRR